MASGNPETYDGPGKLYCFDFNGDLKWGIAFKETLSTMFGELSFMPYLLEVSADSTDILSRVWIDCIDWTITVI